MNTRFFMPNLLSLPQSPPCSSDIPVTGPISMFSGSYLRREFWRNGSQNPDTAGLWSGPAARESFDLGSAARANAEAFALWTASACTNRLKVDAMDISPIKNQRDYRKVLKAIEGLMSAKRNTPEGDRLDVLVTLVEAWERKHYPMDLPDPVEAIKYHMDQNGLQPRDLIPFIGSRNRVHEVLNRRRSLTLKMIWRLHEGLGIPAESLIKVRQEQAA